MLSEFHSLLKLSNSLVIVLFCFVFKSSGSYLGTERGTEAGEDGGLTELPILVGGAGGAGGKRVHMH